MRLNRVWIGITLTVIAAGLVGCAPTVTDATGSGIDDIIGVTDVAAASTSSSPPATAQSQSDRTSISGSVGSNGDYELFALGAGVPGEKWTISPAGLSDYFLVVLLDADHDLLRREIVSSRSPLQHIVRSDTPTVYAGVAAIWGRSGGDFNFSVSRYTGNSIPGPAAQQVWVNFDAGENVRVHNRNGFDFPAFDAARIDGSYAGHTSAIKAAIISAMREDYAPYNVFISSSDDGPPPSGLYATVHIGGDDSRLLGLADNVDEYNADRGQTAVVFADSFADFAVMQLTPGELGQMIGNVASHELGHLLGLYHTAKPVDLMDTTGSAWDLANDQGFTRGVLEQTVFPTGHENSPARLAETVGLNPDAGKLAPSAKLLSREKLLRKAELRAMINHELRCRCGNCLNPDG